MTHLEADLLVAIYAIYASECLYWLRSSEVIFTRANRSKWQQHLCTPRSFSLLGRVPLIVDIFLIHPGVVRIPHQSTSSSPGTHRSLRKTVVALNRHWLLEMQCQLQAMLLLLMLPLAIWTGRLSLLWRPLLLNLVISHLLLMISFVLVLQRHRIPKLHVIAAPFLLNPLGATRLFDALSQAIFHQCVAEYTGRDAF